MPIIAATDYMKIVADQISPWLPGRLTALGTDGFGRSENREHLRRFFEVDAAPSSPPPSRVRRLGPIRRTRTRNRRSSTSASTPRSWTPPTAKGGVRGAVLRAQQKAPDAYSQIRGFPFLRILNRVIPGQPPVDRHRARR